MACWCFECHRTSHPILHYAVLGTDLCCSTAYDLCQEINISISVRVDWVACVHVPSSASSFSLWLVCSYLTRTGCISFIINIRHSVCNHEGIRMLRRCNLTSWKGTKNIFFLNYFSFLNWYLVSAYHNDVLEFSFYIKCHKGMEFEFLKNELISSNLTTWTVFFLFSIIFSQDF